MIISIITNITRIICASAKHKLQLNQQETAFCSKSIDKNDFIAGIGLIIKLLRLLQFNSLHEFLSCIR
jgi:hypothetical protein